MESPDVWNDPERAQALGKEKSQLEKVVETIDELESSLDSVQEILEMAEMDEDQEMVDDVIAELSRLEKKLDE